MVARPDDPCAEVEDRVEVDDARGRLRAHEPHLEEHDRDEHRREELEEALDPQMDDPEAPVVDHRRIRVGAVEERGQIEQRNGDRDVEEERRQSARLRVLHRGPERAEHEKEP